MKKDVTLEEKVLDYWYTLEFLGQDKYPQKELIDANHNARNLKYKLRKGKRGYKSILNFFEIDSKQDIYQQMYNEAQQCGMQCWGNITVYIGKLEREACIHSIAQSFPKYNAGSDRPEKNVDSIACACFQLTPNGKFIEHSFSISPIAWAMKQVMKNRGSISNRLNEEEYARSNTEIENIFFPEKKVFKPLEFSNDIENEGLVQNQHLSNTSNHIQEFAYDSLTYEDIEDIYRFIVKHYLKDYITESIDLPPYEMTVGIAAQMFIDEKTRDKENDDNYYGLSRNYFSEDLNMVMTAIKDHMNTIPDSLLEYIKSVHTSSIQQETTARIDLISPENKNAYAKHMHEILHVKNAPIGKWPSQYMPAIMQQIAINLAIQKGASSLFEGNSQVFSVNGPPGTGKTTLLKEIIVHNIVERAKLLAEYDEPDDAFIEHSFQHGSKYNRAYSKYTQHWYSFKDDRINDYSILVASCNNAAVENLSKELPLGDRILKDLGYNEHAKSKLDGLNEVSNLFDFQKSSEIEYYEKGSVQCPDIYFTYYAQQLLDNQNAWGLIAASLGKKKNIRDFYNYVLKPLRWDFYPKKESSANRLPDFITAKEMFLSQLELVLKMRNQIIQCCDYAYEQINLCEKKQRNEKTLSQLKEESELKIAEYHKTIRQLQTQSADEKRKIKNLTFERDQMLRKQGALKRQIQKEKDNISELKRKASHTMNAVGRKPILFGKAAYSEKIRFAKRVVEDYENQEEQHRTKIDEIQINYQKNEADCLSKELKCNQYKENLRNLENQIKDMNAQIIDYDQRLNHANQELKKIEERLKIVNEDYSITVGNIGVTQTINEDFINALLSDDEQISSDAHVKNPWFTAKYNREREKLFYYAMKLNKAFILASKKCRDNFTSLSHFWGMLPGDEKERIVFHKDDRTACVSALYQTLFLLVPVISTTFASVGSFFGDAKKKNVIGTLVIDEAGQAQPQMAVGALYRSRKAIIVGDPKQIEPVVLDDLKLLKNAFHDKDLEAYVTNKYISVQYCADQMNAYGTYLEETDHPDHLEWIGCPLVVHRRCISPMYDISNAISYNGIMKKKTALPSSDLEQSFIYEKSQWIQIEGIEKGNKNHFVTAQADKVCEMLEIAFEKEKNPSVYIISPFTTVVSGIKKYIQSYCRNHTITVLSNCEDLDAWLNIHIGTVHTFQGKEANEVIFLLGCDKSKGAEGAIKWVNSNIVNVAVTRAKFRLYVIGDATIWQNNPYVQMAKHIIDTFAIKEIHSILKEKDMEERAKKQALKHAMKGLPSITSFPMCEDKEDGNTLDVSVQTDNFVQGLEVHAFMNEPLSSAQLSKFGLKNIHELMRFSPKVRKNLIFGMRLYYFLQPLYCKEQDFDASCCAILFCKAMELQMKECFKKGLCNMFPDDEFKNMKLSQVNENDLTLGAINYIIKHHVLDLGKFMKSIQNTRYDSSWWKEFVEKASKGTRKRNQCCHANSFLWKDLSQLLAYMFKKNKEDQKVAGLMFESSIGKKLVCDNTSKVSAK